MCQHCGIYLKQYLGRNIQLWIHILKQKRKEKKKDWKQARKKQLTFAFKKMATQMSEEISPVPNT